MNRVGVDPAYATEVIDTLIAGGVIVDGVYTHLACADEPSRPENSRQLDAFDSFLSALNARGVNPTRVHAANSAAALAAKAAAAADLKAGKISASSPIGKGLLGKKVGEIAEVVAPNGTMKFMIDNITI